MVKLMKNYLFFFFLFFVSGAVFGQADTVLLRKAIESLDRALMQKDTASIKRLLHTSVSYGHSNGWTQTKNDVIRDLVSGYLKYERLEASELIIRSENDWANVQLKLWVKGEVNNVSFEMPLHVLQVWRKNANDWELIARQSTKITK